MKNYINHLYKIFYWFRPISLFKKIIKLIFIFKPIILDQTSYYPNFVIDFEKLFANKINCNFGVTFSNGTSAIEAALFASEIDKKTEILVCGHTFHATIMSILNYGCIPKLIDANDNLSFDLDDLSGKINAKTSAIILVHLWGIPANVNDILEIAKKNNLKVIEDASHSFGAKIHDKFIGALGLVGCFSLQGSKPIAAGEGGICVTNSEKVRDRLQFYGHFGRVDNDIFKNISAYSDKTGYGKKLRANPLGIRIAYVDLLFFKYTNKRRFKNFNKLKKIFDNKKPFKNIEISKDVTPGGFFGGFPIIYKGNNINLILEIFRKFNIKIYQNPYFNLNKSIHIIDDDTRGEIFLNKKKNIFHKTENLYKVDYLCNNIILLDERYLSYLPRFTIKNINKAINKCSH